MSSVLKTDQIIEFGDFQTPSQLASKVCELLSRSGFQPVSLVEPTCGIGNFIFAALDEFHTITNALGVDILPAYVKQAFSSLDNRLDNRKVRLIEGSFFNLDWDTILAGLPDPLLVVGNPPWVTNAQLSTLNSSNLPEKTNFQKFNGFDAMTGKSNFDISEWMLIRILHWLDNRDALMGMLCKTAVARKVLTYGWKNNLSLSHSAIYHIDAASYFGASVDACLLICRFLPFTYSLTCDVYSNIEETEAKQSIGIYEGELVASIELIKRWKHIRGKAVNLWRSGIKHDCAKVMELIKDNKGYRNGFGEIVELEEDFLYPMLKSSDVANSSSVIPKRWMIVTQKSVRDDTTSIKDVAPKTWEYLQAHTDLLDKRKSSIYKNRSQFSVFGVGDYSFAPWKVAISGFYKKLHFKVVGSYNNKPIVLDDTSYFIPCATQEEAERILSLLSSHTAKEFFEAFIFWDAKRPITIELLRRLDLAALEQHINDNAKGKEIEQSNC